MSKSPSTPAKTTSTTEPPEYLQPYLQDSVGQARDLYYSAPPEFYPGAMSVGFSPQSEQSFQMREQRAVSGSPVTSAANQNATDTLNGNYLYGGEGFNAALDAATRKITPQVDSAFSLAGRSGSGLADVAKTQAISDSFAGLYDNERNRQMQTVNMAPSLAQSDYYDMDQLRSVGGEVESLAQNRLDEDIARYNYYQNMPENRLADYVGLLNGAYPGQTTEAQQPMYKNRAAGAMGGAMAGAKMGSSFGPWGTAIGAIGGGLLGSR